MAFFMFDIDETLLALEQRLVAIDEKVPRQSSLFSPYEPLGYNEPCYTLNKDKMASIFQQILKNGHKIGFITAGKIEQEWIRIFIEKEYGIALDNFMHFNKAYKKGDVLQKIAQKIQCLPKDIYLIDDNSNNIRQASEGGFNTVHVDTREYKGSYITRLEEIIERLQKVEQKEEKSINSSSHVPQKSISTNAHSFWQSQPNKGTLLRAKIGATAAATTAFMGHIYTKLRN